MEIPLVSTEMEGGGGEEFREGKGEIGVFGFCSFFVCFFGIGGCICGRM